MNWPAVDPKCGCFNSQTSLVLNPRALPDGEAGTFGGVRFVPQQPLAAAAAEAMSSGPELPHRREGKYIFWSIL